jgi:hypothetical protein
MDVLFKCQDWAVLFPVMLSQLAVGLADMAIFEKPSIQGLRFCVDNRPVTMILHAEVKELKEEH